MKISNVSELNFFWHRIKRGETIASIAKRYGIIEKDDDNVDGHASVRGRWKVLYEWNKDILPDSKNPNLLHYYSEQDFSDIECIVFKMGVLRIPVSEMDIKYLGLKNFYE